MPFYSALAVLWCIQNHTKYTFSNALQRVVGTAVGAIFGLLFILGKIYIVDLGNGIVHYLVLSLFVIPVIYTTILLHRGNTSYFSCVVYLSIVVNHLTDENPFLFDISVNPFFKYKFLADIFNSFTSKRILFECANFFTKSISLEA